MAYFEGVENEQPPSSPVVGSRVRNDFNAGYICERISEGETLAQVCRDLQVSRQAVYMWIEDDPAFAKRMEAARQCGYDAIAEEIVRIADDASGDRSETGVPNKEFTARSKLRAEVRLKLLAKWHPKRYGDKLEVEQTTRQANLELPADIDAVEAARRYSEWIKG